MEYGRAVSEVVLSNVQFAAEDIYTKASVVHWGMGSAADVAWWVIKEPCEEFVFAPMGRSVLDALMYFAPDGVAAGRSTGMERFRMERFSGRWW